MLQKQTVNISFSKGIDTINDPYLVESDRFLAIENGIFLKNGSLKKRNGFNKIGMNLVGSDTELTDVRKLAIFNDSLVALSAGTLYSYAKERNQWTEKGGFSTVNINTYPVVRNSQSQSNFDFTRVSDIDINVWQQDNDIYYSVQDAIANSNIVKDTIIHDSSATGFSGSFPQIGVIGTTILLFYWVAETTDKLYVKIIETGTPDIVTTVATPVANVPSGDSAKPFKITSCFSGCLVSYQDSSSQYIELKFVNREGEANPVLFPSGTHTEVGNYTSTSMAVTTNENSIFVYYSIDSNIDTISVSGTTITLDSTGEITHVQDGDTVVFSDASGVTTATTTATGVDYNNGTFTVLDATGITTGDYIKINGGVPTLDVFRHGLPAATDTFNHTSLRVPVGVSGISSLYYVSDTLLALAGSPASISDPLTDAEVKHIDITMTNPYVSDLSSFAISSAINLTNDGVMLSSNIFVVDSNLYTVVSYQGQAADVDNLQPTRFIIDWNGAVVAKVLPAISGNHVSTLTNVIIDNNKAYFPAGVRTRLSSQNGLLLATTGISKVEADFGNTEFYVSQLGENLHITGGFLYDYDGQVVVEHNFHIFPEKPTLTEGSSGESSGDYSYVLAYEWTDARGQIHQSTPSAPSAITITGTQVIISGARLSLTAKETPRIAIYRTVNGGTTYYKLADIANTANWSYTDSTTDTVLERNQFLYTTGGNLENSAPPSCSILQRHNNRLFLSGLEDTNTVWYSKEYTENEPVNFSDLLYFKVNPSGGAITALASLDDKLVIFKEDSIYVLSGQGPTDAGANNDYITPQFVTGNIGCVVQESLVVIPEGLIFKSDKGIWLLNRGLGLDYIGAPVEDFNSLTITSAIAIPDKNQVIFTTLDGNALVFQSLLKQWTTLTNYESLHSITYKNEFYHVDVNSMIHKEDTGYRDNGFFYPLKITTSWLKTEAQGRFRFYTMGILGKFTGDPLLRISKYSDYDELTPEFRHFTTSDELDFADWGTEETYWGTATTYGTDKNRVFQFNCEWDKQKLSSVKFIFEDLPTTTLESSYEFSNLTLQLAVAPGIMNKGREGV